MTAKEKLEIKIIAYCIANMHKSKHIGENWHKGLKDIVAGLAQDIFNWTKQWAKSCVPKERELGGRFKTEEYEYRTLGYNESRKETIKNIEEG